MDCGGKSMTTKSFQILQEVELNFGNIYGDVRSEGVCISFVCSESAVSANLLLLKITIKRYLTSWTNLLRTVLLIKFSKWVLNSLYLQ